MSDYGVRGEDVREEGSNVFRKREEAQRGRRPTIERNGEGCQRGFLRTRPASR